MAGGLEALMINQSPLENVDRAQIPPTNTMIIYSLAEGHLMAVMRAIVAKTITKIMIRVLYKRYLRKHNSTFKTLEEVKLNHRSPHNLTLTQSRVEVARA